MTHLVTGEEPDDNETGMVKDIYEKPVVTQRWVLLSTKCGKQLPWTAFSPDTTQLFSGVQACVSQLGIQDTLTVWAMLTYFGGQFSLRLDKSCTHLITGKPEGAKYRCALENEETVTPVTPDWLKDCIDEGSKLDESDYHPRLLRLPKSQAHLTPQQSRPKRRVRKKEKPKPVVEEPVKEEPKKKELEEKKSLFDTLEFSDDDDDVATKDSGSLLDQLKTSQAWKQPSTKPTVTTRSSAASIDKPKTPLTVPIQASTPQPPPPSPTPVTAAAATTTITTTTTTQPSSSAKITPPQMVSKSTPTQALTEPQPSIVSTPETVQKLSSSVSPQSHSPSSLTQVTTAGTPAQFITTTTQLTNSTMTTMVTAPAIPSAPATAATGLINAQHLTPQQTIAEVAPQQITTTDNVIPPLTATNIITTTNNLDVPAPMTPQGVATRAVGPAPRLLPPGSSVRPAPLVMTRAMPPAMARAVPPPVSSRATPPNTSRATPPINSRATPPITSRVTPPINARNTPPAPPVTARTTPPTLATSRATPPMPARATLPPGTRPAMARGVLPGGAGRTVVGTPGGVRVPTMPLTMPGPTVRAPGAVSQVAPGGIPAPNMPSTLPQQQVHTVAIPGAVVRLPHGVTPQQLQMMSPNERQTFLQNLHQKQMQEQQARGKPRAGKPPGPQVGRETSVRAAPLVRQTRQETAKNKLLAVQQTRQETVKNAILAVRQTRQETAKRAKFTMRQTSIETANRSVLAVRQTLQVMDKSAVLLVRQKKRMNNRSPLIVRQKRQETTKRAMLAVRHIRRENGEHPMPKQRKMHLSKEMAKRGITTVKETKRTMKVRVTQTVRQTRKEAAEKNRVRLASLKMAKSTKTMQTKQKLADETTRKQSPPNMTKRSTLTLRQAKQAAIRKMPVTRQTRREIVQRTASPTLNHTKQKITGSVVTTLVQMKFNIGKEVLRADKDKNRHINHEMSKKAMTSVRQTRQSVAKTKRTVKRVRLCPMCECYSPAGS
ncbi:hypothetical protein Pmani_015717 [Petrolisthes manimaculis]|uniref:BRCT domain-containing protein n=1 Tax=Petrolisthes manimaculis TaxID=1843537 RepID=A0AAE1PRL6_9EUCA|nr:hypothetical protein Pmani_015717 [Petrolisthes manimaculis]